MSEAVLPAGRPVPFVPAEGRIDRRQLAALLRLLSAQMLRRGTDGSSGLSGNPLLQALYSMGFLGLLAASGVFRAPDLDTYLARTFASALVIVALMITAETDEVRIRRAEILLPKPVSGATHLAAVAALLFLSSSIIAGSYVLFPLLAASARLGLSPLLIPLLLVTLIAGAFGVVLVWVLVLRMGVHRFGADRIRMATQIAIVALIGLVSWSTLAAVAGGSGPPQVSLTVLEALPSTWLARFWTDGWSAAANLKRLGVLSLLGASVLLFSRYAHRASADSIFETTTRSRLARTPLLARALTGLGRVPGLRLLLPAPAAALAGCILTVGGREEVSRMRGLVTTLLAVGFAVWGFWSDAGLLPVSLLSSIVVSITLEGLAIARQSASAPAAWAIAKSPVTARHIVRAVQWAVTTRFVLVPLALFSVLVFRGHPWGLATVLTLAGLLTARLIIAGALAIRPSFPLDDAPVVTGAVGQIVAYGCGVAGALAYVMAAMLSQLLGAWATALVAVATAAIGVAAAIAQVLAARRIARLEHLG